jgi:glycyl-tRNA synthetase beta chain
MTNIAPAAPLLIELFCEELPPKALARLGNAFAESVLTQLRARRFVAAGIEAIAFATPRRLAVRIPDVRAKAPDAARREKVLPVSVAFNAEGKPQPPLLKKLAALGLTEADIPNLERTMDGKAEALFHAYVAPGKTLHEVLDAVLAEAISKLPIPKVMSYQLADLSTVQFVRPVHRLVVLHGDQVVPARLLGLTSGNTTLGHRFLSEGPITIASANAYEGVLEHSGKVVASFAERRARIVEQLNALAGDDSVVAPDALLDEVTALVEWPVVLEAHFEETFLDVPQECLVLTMQMNQKYFALTDAKGKLRNRFLLVSNLQAEDSSRITGGNERVLRARLADAKFFYDTDRKQPLASRLDGLDAVTYHNRLGTLRARVERIIALAASIAVRIPGADVELAKRAALLAKCDLVTGMVGEFPELQGVMGEYYARHDGEAESVSGAIGVQYRPRMDDACLINDGVVASLYLADRIEVLVGIWGIGLQPTGEKDPYALRRAALGVIDVLQGLGGHAPDIQDLLDSAVALFPTGTLSAGTACEVIDFVYERVRNQLNADHDKPTVDAVMALRPPLSDIAPRVRAVTAFRALPEAEALAAANKRIGNILKKNEVEPGRAGAVNPDLFAEPAEHALADALNATIPLADAAFESGDYAGALQVLAQLRGPVDAFFNDVMVMADDLDVRANRIALLAQLHGLMNRVADLSRLAA